MKEEHKFLVGLVRQAAKIIKIHPADFENLTLTIIEDYGDNDISYMTVEDVIDIAEAGGFDME